MPCCSRVFNWETEIRDKKRQDALFYSCRRDGVMQELLFSWLHKRILVILRVCFFKLLSNIQYQGCFWSILTTDIRSCSQ